MRRLAQQTERGQSGGGYLLVDLALAAVLGRELGGRDGAAGGLRVCLHLEVGF